MIAKEAVHQPPILVLVLVDHGAGATSIAAQARRAGCQRAGQVGRSGTAGLGMPAPR